MREYLDKTSSKDSKSLIPNSRKYSIWTGVSQGNKPQEAAHPERILRAGPEPVLAIHHLSSQFSLRQAPPLTHGPGNRDDELNEWQCQWSNPGALDSKAGALSTRAHQSPWHIQQGLGDRARLESKDW